MTVLKPLRKSWCFSSSTRTRTKAARARESVFSDCRSWVRFLRPHKISQLNMSISSEEQKAEQTCWAAEQHECVVRQEGEKIPCKKFPPPPHYRTAG